MKPETLIPQTEISGASRGWGQRIRSAEKEFFVDNLLVRIDFIIVMIRWTGLAPWVFQFPFSDSLTSNFLEVFVHLGWTRFFDNLGLRNDFRA